MKSAELDNSKSIEDTSITSFELLSVTESYMKIQITFFKPDKISENLLEPDSLEINLKLGWLFIDKKDF